MGLIDIEEIPRLNRLRDPCIPKYPHLTNWVILLIKSVYSSTLGFLIPHVGLPKWKLRRSMRLIKMFSATLSRRLLTHGGSLFVLRICVPLSYNDPCTITAGIAGAQPAPKGSWVITSWPTVEARVAALCCVITPLLNSPQSSWTGRSTLLLGMH